MKPLCVLEDQDQGSQRPPSRIRENIFKEHHVVVGINIKFIWKRMYVLRGIISAVEEVRNDKRSRSGSDLRGR
jgi:hypothetical protein